MARAMRSERSTAVVGLHRTNTRIAAHDIERVYRLHYAAVFRYVLGLTRSSPDAEEIVSEVFMRALQGWTAVPPSPLPWLLLAARRVAIDRLRRARIQARLLPWIHSTLAAEPSEHRTEFWIWFDAVSAVLTERQREVLLLRYERDLADDDIARILGLSASGVRSLIARALEALRRHPELLR
jgi:RNA polymerase sigma factor (sigma-70 family)